MVPLLLTQAIILVPGHLAGVRLGIGRFLRRRYKVGDRDGRIVELLLFAGVVYFVICYSGTLLVRHSARGWAQSMVSIRNVSKHYGDFQVLTDCHRGKQGEVIVVCGPSGSGKSTLIKVCQRARGIQAGEISSTVSRSADAEDRFGPSFAACRHGLSALRAVSHMTTATNLTIAQQRVSRVRPRDEAMTKACAPRPFRPEGPCRQASRPVVGRQQQRVAILPAPWRMDPICDVV